MPIYFSLHVGPCIALQTSRVNLQPHFLCVSDSSQERIPPTCHNTKSGRAAVFPLGGGNPAPMCLRMCKRRVRQAFLCRPCAFRRACIKMPASFACFSCLALLKSVVFLGPLGELGVMPPWSSLPLWLPLESLAEMIAPKVWFSRGRSRN